MKTYRIGNRFKCGSQEFMLVSSDNNRVAIVCLSTGGRIAQSMECLDCNKVPQDTVMLLMGNMYKEMKGVDNTYGNLTFGSVPYNKFFTVINTGGIRNSNIYIKRDGCIFILDRDGLSKSIMLLTDEIKGYDLVHIDSDNPVRIDREVRGEEII